MHDIITPESLRATADNISPKAASPTEPPETNQGKGAT